MATGHEQLEGGAPGRRPGDRPSLLDGSLVA